MRKSRLADSGPAVEWNAEAVRLAIEYFDTLDGFLADCWLSSSDVDLINSDAVVFGAATEGVEAEEEEGEDAFNVRDCMAGW